MAPSTAAQEILQVNAWKLFLRHEAQWASSDQTEAAKSGDLAPITDCGL